MALSNYTESSSSSPAFTSPSSSILKIYFISIDFVGHMNASIGLAQALARRGHQISFLLNESNAGRFVRYGPFREIILSDNTTKSAQDKEDDTKHKDAKNLKIIQQFSEGKNLGIHDAKNSTEMMKNYIKVSQKLIEFHLEQLIKNEPLIEPILQQERPDLMIMDCSTIYPCILRSGIPYISQFSTQPLWAYYIHNMNDDYYRNLVPPYWSGK